MKVKKLLKSKISLFLLVGLIFISLIGYGINWAFFDMNRLPTGEYLTEETSPDGKYTVKAYLNNAGATTSYTIRGELVYHQKNDKTQNVYWNVREESAEIIWIDKDTVEINGHSLNVPKETFDFRRQ